MAKKSACESTKKASLSIQVSDIKAQLEYLKDVVNQQNESLKELDEAFINEIKQRLTLKGKVEAQPAGIEAQNLTVDHLHMRS